MTSPHIPLSNSPDSTSTQQQQLTSSIGTFIFGPELGRGSFATVYLAYNTSSLTKPSTPTPEAKSVQASEIKEYVKNPPIDVPRVAGMNDRSLGKLGTSPSSPVSKAAYFAKKYEMVAVKSVLRDKLNRKLAENLESEIRILKGSRCEYVVGLYDIVKTDKHIHLLMEYCSMGDLSAFIKKKGKIPGVTNPEIYAGHWGGLSDVIVRHFLKQIASAVEFLRAKSLIHRDLKPQNLLLAPGSPHPCVKLADFGFARILIHQTMAATLCGSPLYMAPEILKGDKYDAKADLWSVGTILYEMIAGTPPYKAGNHVELVRMIEHGKLEFPDTKKLEQLKEGGREGIKVEKLRKINHLIHLDEFDYEEYETSPPKLAPKPINAADLKPVLQIESDMKDLIERLLKKNPVERISFEEFFLHPCVKGRGFGSGLKNKELMSVHEVDPYVVYEKMSGSSLPKQNKGVKDDDLINVDAGDVKKSGFSEDANIPDPKSPVLSSSSISSIGSLELSGIDSKHGGDDKDDFVMVEKRVVEVNWFADVEINGARASTPDLKLKSGEQPEIVKSLNGANEALKSDAIKTEVNGVTEAPMKTLEASPFPIPNPTFGQLNEYVNRTISVHTLANEYFTASISSVPITHTEESLNLYLLCLSLYQTLINISKQIWNQEGQKVAKELSFGVEWIKEMFNVCLERAEVCKGVVEDAGENLDNDSKIKSAEAIVREKADELIKISPPSQPNYTKAALLLEALLIPLEDGMEEPDCGLIEKLVVDVYKKLKDMK
ncbi:Serine/threonine-protein kinase [Nowakowskiella sp. JEL0407]|nr:Serine/threonine-protein kinase [Nowakowskiella sp. JEL0407]